MAVGRDDSTLLPLIVARVHGVWGAAVDLVRSGLSQGELTAVSCSAPGTCVAVGHDVATNAPFAVREQGGVFGPVDRLTSISIGGNTTTLAGYFTGVSCPTATSCTAIGYDVDKALPFLTTLTNGTWSTPLLIGIDHALNGVELNGISCVNATTCMAVGVDHNLNQATTLAENNGQWSPLTNLLTTRMRGNLHSNQGVFTACLLYTSDAADE